MQTLSLRVSLLTTLAAGVWWACPARRSPKPHAAPPVAVATPPLANLPIAFVPNVGQWQHRAQFVVRLGAMTVFLERNGWTFTLVERDATAAKLATGDEGAVLRGAAVRMTFLGSGTAEVAAEEQLAGRHNYFLGNDPAHWRSDVPLYRSVLYRHVHAGIDVRARSHEGHFEYDLVLQAGANLEPVEIAVEGIDGLRVDQAGTLVLETRLGPVRMPLPVSWEEGPAGQKTPIVCRYVLRGNHRFGFEVPGRQPGWGLVVDPGLVWSTFLGGSNGNDANAVAVDAQGAATVVGATFSSDFPTTPGAFDRSWAFDTDVFVTRLTPNGSSLVYSTYLGGIGADVARALALDALGNATVAGSTTSFDWPTTPGAFDTTFHLSRDAFVAKLSPTGSSLLYSTYLGADATDEALGVAIDAVGAPVVVGRTLSTGFPVTGGAFDTSHNGGPDDVFVTKLTANGSGLVYSTFVGGSATEEASAVVLDAAGASTITGITGSTDFPTTAGAFDTSYGANGDAFVTRLSATGASLIYSTYLGGSGFEWAQSLAQDARGAVTCVGRTNSMNFPTTPGAYDTTHNGAEDVFVTRLAPSGASLAYSTYIGGADADAAWALGIDAGGAATLAGSTLSVDFPTTAGAFDTSWNANQDAFVARLSPSGSSLVYSTYLGGTGFDFALGLALDARGAPTVVGRTLSTGFPTTGGAFDTTHNGIADGFVTRLDLLPTGVSSVGASSPGCSGPSAISVNSIPRVGNAAFALTCTNAPLNASGLLALATTGLVAPLPVLGIQVWFDPAGLLTTLTVASDALGSCTVPLPIPNNPPVAGARLVGQFVWVGPTAPPPCPPLGFSASNAIEVIVQP